MIITSTLIDYFAAIAMGKTQSNVKRRIYLLLSLFSNLGILFFFKYFTFFNESIQLVLSQFNILYDAPSFKFLLPVGISFYTFQTLSYTIEVYRGNRKPEKHLGIFALYVSFFPQLVAGPIERAQNLLPQFFKKYTFDYDRVTSGLKLMAWGMFKKVVVADRLAIMVDVVYSQLTFFDDGLILIIAAVFFAFQIYYDFSAYSDIAIGAAQVMGFKLMVNFKRPYFSRSISEIWTRWHISLTTWLRDYLYIPLGGNRVSIPRGFLNTFIIFTLCGLWHGANWTFVVFGALQAFYMVFSIITKSIRKNIVKTIRLDKSPSLYKWWQIIITFCLWCFGGIFFRANNISDSIYIIKHLTKGWEKFFCLTGFEYFNHTIRDIYGILMQSQKEFYWSIALIVFTQLAHLIQENHGSIRKMLSEKPTWVRWPLYILLVYSIFNYGIMRTIPFIYFQF